ncbi:shikimate kinase [Paenibacillus xerothermodurans]
MQNVVLIGFAGSGKSTVGRALSERLGWRFVDTDQQIEAEQCTTISEIFKLQGEAAFRALESEMIERTLADNGQVISTGGGAVLAERDRICMKTRGFVIALTASLETIISRVSLDENRPLVQGNVEEKVKALMQRRKHAYDFADLTIDTTGLTVKEIVDRVEQAL